MSDALGLLFVGAVFGFSLAKLIAWMDRKAAVVVVRADEVRTIATEASVRADLEAEGFSAIEVVEGPSGDLIAKGRHKFFREMESRPFFLGKKRITSPVHALERLGDALARYRWAVADTEMREEIEMSDARFDWRQAKRR